MLYWKEKEVIEPAMAGVGLFTLAKLSAVVGFILIMVAGVMKLRKLDERPYRAPSS
jgi:flagellar biogenesis protein FliO